MAFWKVSVEEMMNGASGDVLGMRDDEPMCMHSTVCVSSQARNTGAQWLSRSWTEGSPNGVGFSGKVMAKLPLPAQRWISAAANSASHNGTKVSGMSVPAPSPADHTSIIQSL